MHKGSCKERIGEVAWVGEESRRDYRIMVNKALKRQRILQPKFQIKDISVYEYDQPIDEWKRFGLYVIS